MSFSFALFPPACPGTGTCHFCYFPSSRLKKCSHPGVFPRCSLLLNTPIQRASPKQLPAHPAQQVSSASISGPCKAAAAPEGQPSTTACPQQPWQGFRASRGGGQSHISTSSQQSHADLSASQPEDQPCQTACLQQSQPTTAGGHTQPTLGKHLEPRL